MRTHTITHSGCPSSWNRAQIRSQWFAWFTQPPAFLSLCALLLRLKPQSLYPGRTKTPWTATAACVEKREQNPGYGWVVTRCLFGYKYLLVCLAKSQKCLFRAVDEACLVLVANPWGYFNVKRKKTGVIWNMIPENIMCCVHQLLSSFTECNRFCRCLWTTPDTLTLTWEQGNKSTSLSVPMAMAVLTVEGGQVINHGVMWEWPSLPILSQATTAFIWSVLETLAFSYLNTFLHVFHHLPLLPSLSSLTSLKALFLYPQVLLLMQDNQHIVNIMYESTGSDSHLSTR